ncbi:MAG: extracellular solute-binding protein [Phycisphaerales bacterium]|nr:extracellular solute-binding protein [Phycisphaerales bacterium]
MNRRRWLAATALIACTLATLGCRDHDARPTVVLYYSADDHIARPIIQAFEEQTGIDVRERGDTEANKTTGLVEKLRAERNRPRADVFWSSEVFLTTRLADEDILAPCHTAVTDAWPDAWTGREHRWHGFACRARVVVYNTERVAPGDVPRTMHDLLNPKFRDRVVMARPQFGTTRGHMAMLVNLWGPERTEAFLMQLADNGVRLVDGNSTVVRMVARGEAWVGLTDTDDVIGGQRNDWPVEASLVRHDVDDLTIGPMVIPNTVALVNGAPHPEPARQLIDFLLSARVEEMLAESDSRNIPVRPDLAARLDTWDISDPAPIDYHDVAASMHTAMQLCDRILAGR